jgi:hypothetical protein
MWGVAAHHVWLGALNQFRFLDNPTKTLDLLGEAMPQTISYSLLTTMRYDPNEVDTTESDFNWTLEEQEIATHIWLSSLHVQRLRSAAEEHGWLAAARLDVGIFLKSCLAASKATADFCSTNCAYKARSRALPAKRSGLTY